MVEAGSLPLHTQTVDIKGQCNIGSPAMPPKVPQKFKFSDLQGFSAFFRESNPRPLVVQAVADATFVPLREVLCRARGGTFLAICSISKGGRLGKRATRSSVPPIASTYRLSVERSISLRRSRREMVSCPTPREEASSSCVCRTARRRSFSVASSAARRSTFARRFAGNFARTCSRFLAMTAPFPRTTDLPCSHSGQMPIEPFIGYGDQTPVKPLLIRPALVSAHQQDGPSAGIECKGNSPHLA